MLKEFENWLLEQNYKPTTAADYHGRIERLCRKEEFTLAYLMENIASILPEYESAGKKSSYGKRSHTSVKQALRRFKMFLSATKLA
jgi:hypothetical protein